MLLRDLKGFVDAFPDGHRRHHDNKLGESVLAVQLKDSLGVNVGLAGAGFHLNTELAAFRCGGQGQVVPLLDGVHIGGQCFLVNVESITLAQLIQKIGLAVIHDGEGAFRFLLAGKQVYHGIDCLGLKVLRFEFEFHV